MDLICTSINNLPICLPKPPEQVSLIVNNKWYKPVAFRVPKKGEYSWDLISTEISSPLRPILVYNFCDGVVPEWIYEEVK